MRFGWGAQGVEVAPCGACGAYVPALAGCKHWRPVDLTDSRPLSSAERSARYRARRAGRRAPTREELRAAAERRIARQQSREWEKAARERAKLAVEEFRRAMNRQYTG